MATLQQIRQRLEIANQINPLDYDQIKEHIYIDALNIATDKWIAHSTWVHGQEPTTQEVFAFADGFYACHQWINSHGKSL